jgi:hypothetical protein
MANLPQQNPGLTSSAAHNAAATLVEMYRGILVDNEREKTLLRGRIAQLEAELMALRKAPLAAKESVSRGRSRERGLIVRGFMTKAFQEQMRLMDQENGVDHRLDYWVENFGDGAAGWLLWTHRKLLRRDGAVDFQIPKNIPTPAWMRIALETIRRRAHWSVTTHVSERAPLKHYRVRYHRHGHFKPKPSLPPEQIS